MGKHSQYGVILDAGSSGTRIYVYKWKHPIAASENLSPVDLRKLPNVKLKKSKKIHPGIATFADDPTLVGRDHLQPLIDAALDEIPSHKIKATPIYLMATAGVRFLSQSRQLSLLRQVCAYLKANTNFHLSSCKEQVQVIAGETEGIYGWIATNYLLGGLDRPEEHSHGKGHHTYGFLDMGGASAQIAFAPNATEAERHATDLKLIRLRHLDGSSSEFQIYSATWLGFGANKARSRFVQTLVESYGDTAKEIPDPCTPKGLRIPAAKKLSADQTFNNGCTLLGTGIFDECLRKTYPLLGKDKPCEDYPCLLDGKHAPAIDFEVNHFLGVSEYWHVTHGVFGKGREAYDLATFQHKVIDFCGREWETIQSEILHRNKNPKKGIEDAVDACFKASWLINVLYEGIGIPRLGPESKTLSNISATAGSKQDIPKEEFLDSFQPVDTVRGVEVSWTLGKMVLYAAGQILPVASKLPVGFGSNIAAEIPPDFEHAGSTPLSAEFLSENQSFDVHQGASSFDQIIYIVFILMVIVIVLLAYIFQRPDRRRTISQNIMHWRRQWGRQSRRRETLIGRVFGRANYERVLEEGDTADYELDASDDLDCSADSEGLHGNTSCGGVNTKTNLRFDQGSVPSMMDRAGLVVRTESRERLSTNLQMLNAGRRSRAGSPTRLKSPFMAPLQDT
ncbi:hypothetical protein E4U55_000323 [Claviceps digitariae]|nr:hypothetical protein E4U55_000323 [Claviceps digitariae]